MVFILFLLSCVHFLSFLPELPDMNVHPLSVGAIRTYFSLLRNVGVATLKKLKYLRMIFDTPSLQGDINLTTKSHNLDDFFSPSPWRGNGKGTLSMMKIWQTETATTITLGGVWTDSSNGMKMLTIEVGAERLYQRDRKVKMHRWVLIEFINLFLQVWALPFYQLERDYKVSSSCVPFFFD